MLKKKKRIYRCTAIQVQNDVASKAIFTQATDVTALLIHVELADTFIPPKIWLKVTSEITWSQMQSLDYNDGDSV